VERGAVQFLTDREQAFSLTPGFSQVETSLKKSSRVNGFDALRETVKTVETPADPSHRAEARC
jgi:hypothetical protein